MCCRSFLAAIGLPQRGQMIGAAPEFFRLDSRTSRINFLRAARAARALRAAALSRFFGAGFRFGGAAFGLRRSTERELTGLDRASNCDLAACL